MTNYSSGLQQFIDENKPADNELSVQEWTYLFKSIDRDVIILNHKQTLPDHLGYLDPYIDLKPGEYAVVSLGIPTSKKFYYGKGFGIFRKFVLEQEHVITVFDKAMIKFSETIEGDKITFTPSFRLTYTEGCFTDPPGAKLNPTRLTKDQLARVLPEATKAKSPEKIMCMPVTKWRDVYVEYGGTYSDETLTCFRSEAIELARQHWQQFAEIGLTSEEIFGGQAPEIPN